MVSIRIIMRRCMGIDKKNEGSVADLVCTILYRRKIFNVFSLTFSSSIINSSFINLLAEIIHSCKSIPANITLAKLSGSLNNLQRKAALV